MKQRAVPLSDVPPAWRGVLAAIALGKFAVGGAGLGVVAAAVLSLATSALGAEIMGGYQPMQIGATVGAALGACLGLRDLSSALRA